MYTYCHAITDESQRDLAGNLEQLVERLLELAAIEEPPIDVRRIASALGLSIAFDESQAGRARLVRLQVAERDGGGSILVRREPRPERLQWSIAHEIGESQVAALFWQLGLDARETSPGLREQFANQITSRLLLPACWFESLAKRVNWDLFALKHHFHTASHELIARRMTDFAPPVVITVFDQGRITWRQSNLPGRIFPLTSEERDCRQQAHALGETIAHESSTCHVQSWPIHETNWQREIIRYEWRGMDEG